MTITFEPAYAYPTSAHAQKLNRSYEGCHYVQQCEGIEPGTICMGPFETRKQAAAWADLCRWAIGGDATAEKTLKDAAGNGELGNALDIT